MINIDELRNGKRKTLAKAITLLESNRLDHRELAELLIQDVMPFSGNSIRIGLTGVPGVGKSTLIEALGNHVIDQGHKIAVLAIDPSSTLSGGSILGDKTRMPTLAVNSNAFIRPTPAGESIGGVARHTRDSIVLCEAAGFDVIVVETVGVGQSETVASDLTDIFLLMLLPGSGDELQGIKRGIMELADVVVVNKADGELKAGANMVAADIQQALRLIVPRHENWRVPVITISAQENIGIDAVWKCIEQFRDCLDNQGCLVRNRQQQSKNWMWIETKNLLMDSFKSDIQVQALLANLQLRVVAGELPSSLAAKELVSRFLENHK